MLPSSKQLEPVTEINTKQMKNTADFHRFHALKLNLK